MKRRRQRDEKVESFEGRKTQGRQLERAGKKLSGEDEERQEVSWVELGIKNSKKQCHGIVKNGNLNGRSTFGRARL